jgi:cyclophilin family peptidyl-prolyl cis-trans isomerase
MQTKNIIITIVLIGMIVMGTVLTVKRQQSVDTPIDTIPTNEPILSDQTKIMTSSKNAMQHTITLETSLGNIVFHTYDGLAPKTVENFVTLAKKGFYDNVIFHRVIKDFMIQGGDPTGTGMGGPGYKFNDELDATSPIAKEGYKRGVVAMANAGPDTNGSQFFIMHKDVPLPYNYTIFGEVISGIDVVDKIAELSTDQNDRPINPPKILKVTVEEIQ